MEYDYLLHDELEDAYEFETPLHAELIHTMIPYEETAEEKEVVQRTWTLDRVPASLEKQFSDYKDWRLSPLNFQRQGNAVVDTTANSDRGTTQRFLAYCQAEHGIAPTLATFGTAHLATLAQSWLEKLSERGLMWSTLGTYCNSLCNLAAYWWGSDGAVEEGALAMEVQPPDLLLRLRAQCEAQSRQQQLYAKKPDNWLEVRASNASSYDLPSTHEQPTSVLCFGAVGQGAGGEGEVRRRMGELRKALARQEGGAAEGVPRAAVSYRDAVRIGFESLDPPPAS
jgi:hypothetical protein